jgi:hypothetical protein
MLISELTFPHLLAERDAQLTRELEWRRVANERLESEREGAAAIAQPSRSARRAHRAATSAKRRRGDELTGSSWTSTLNA